jgi:hypothetical protein
MWEAISEEALLSLIAAAEAAMDAPVLAFWERVRVRPVKWALPPWGDEGGGFWVVAVLGQTCVWYNDIEDGFNISRFEAFGRIADYWCNQAELQHCIAGFFERFLQGLGGPAGSGKGTQLVPGLERGAPRAGMGT